ncbi:MAG: acetylxylan esterase [Verrucomicrobia bacterium]|nr:acetylxylan esterase [Verrucomicrobiota bacterium]
MRLIASLSRTLSLAAPVGLGFLLAPGQCAGGPLPEFAALPVQTNLPDPLVMLDGTRVTTPDAWVSRRRPELQALFQHYMYGALPPKPAAVQFDVEREDARYFGGKATKKEVYVSAGNLKRMHLLVVIPNRRAGPAPVFLGMNFCGNHAVVNDPGIPLSGVWVYSSCKGCTNNRATEASRGAEVDTWSVEQSVDRGYAVATFYSGDLVPDRADLIEGARAQYGTRDGGAIAVWAWGYHRAVDYLVTDPALDARRIAVFGHSRNGKTALLAAAFDERIALAIPHQAGCGGTAPSRTRNPRAETVKRINTSFPHWFNAVYKEFNDEPARLPFDQHALMALAAPRPVLLSNATLDQWADPGGQFDLLKAADPVYRLLGVEGLAARAMPPEGTLVDSRLGYFIRPGRHSTTREDWKVFLEFADRHLGKAR